MCEQKRWMSTRFKVTGNVWTITGKHVHAPKRTYFVRILQMVIVHLLYGLEVNDSFHLGLMFVCSKEHKHNCSWTNDAVIKPCSLHLRHPGIA